MVISKRTRKHGLRSIKTDNLPSNKRERTSIKDVLFFYAFFLVSCPRGKLYLLIEKLEVNQKEEAKMTGRSLAVKVMKSLSKLQKYQILSKDQTQVLLQQIINGKEISSVEDVIYALYAYDVPDGKEGIFEAVIDGLRAQKGGINTWEN